MNAVFATIEGSTSFTGLHACLATGDPKNPYRPCGVPRPQSVSHRIETTVAAGRHRTWQCICYCRVCLQLPSVFLRGATILLRPHFPTELDPQSVHRHTMKGTIVHRLSPSSISITIKSLIRHAFLRLQVSIKECRVSRINPSAAATNPSSETYDCRCDASYSDTPEHMYPVTFRPPGHVFTHTKQWAVPFGVVFHRLFLLHSMTRCRWCRTARGTELSLWGLMQDGANAAAKAVSNGSNNFGRPCSVL